MPFKKSFHANNSPIPAINYHKCIAKTTDYGDLGQTVVEHGMNTAEVIKQLLPLLPDCIQTTQGSLCQLSAAIHDIGKISPGFQKKIQRKHLENSAPELAALSPTSFESMHDIIGGISVYNFFKNHPLSETVAQIVAAHHGNMKHEIKRSDSEEILGGTLWSTERHNFLSHMIEKTVSLPNVQPDKINKELCAGLLCVADWIASDSDNFRKNDSRPLEKQAHEAVQRCGFFLSEFSSNLSFSDIFGFKPYSIQNKFINAVTEPGLYILEAPMGCGKTEAALYAAYKLISGGKNRGFYFGLPTRLTSDKIHKRVSSFLNQISDTGIHPKLAHSTAWLTDFLNGGAELSTGASWFNPRKRNLLFPYAVGTIDQALLSVLRVKHYFVRHFALAGKVIILDEVHSYDAYTGNLMVNLVRHLLKLNCTVILLSATLTREKRQLFFNKENPTIIENSYPLITVERNEKVSPPIIDQPIPGNSHDIHIINNNTNNIIDLAITEANKGQCVLCIANTVKRAQLWYNELRRRKIDFDIGLLHSRFPQYLRNEIEDKWLQKLDKNGDRPNGCILISTQIVEQSIDIDADLMITDLAPTDMILQRMGRQWRHHRTNRTDPRPRTFIVSDDPSSATSCDEVKERLGNSTCKVYDPYILYRSFLVWENKQNVSLPADIRPLLTATYQEHTCEPNHIVKLKTDADNFRNDLKKIAISAMATEADIPCHNDDDSVMTRYDQVKRTNILLIKNLHKDTNNTEITLLDNNKITTTNKKKEIKISALLHNNCVSIPNYLIPNIIKEKMPEYLNKHFYQKTIPLQVNDNDELIYNDVASGLYFSPQLGIYDNTTKASDTIEHINKRKEEK